MEGRWKFAILVIALFCCGVNAQNQTTEASTTPTEEPPTTAPPTTKATTTKASTTSTQAPTTTTPSPSTTPVPAPEPFPSNEGRWTVENEANASCILLKGALEVTVAYVDLNNKNRTGNVDVPKSALSSGSCEETNQYITLTWNSSVILKDNSTGLNKLMFVFESNNTTGVLSAGTGITQGKFGLQNITGVIYKEPTAFPNVTEAETPFAVDLKNKAAFQTPLNHSYACLAQEVLKSDDGTIVLKFSDIRVEAFKMGAPNHKEFSAAVDCPADDASDVVPIAVGAALAGLVVIVLVAYLIGRRRSRARGYQSV